MKVVNRFIFAVSHLTRLPVPFIEFDPQEFGRSTAVFPLVGLLLGGIIASFNKLLLVFPPELRASIFVLLTVILTGGMHLDGFMDCIDGIMSGKSRERKLEIMRDSRVGALGAAYGTCLLLLKYSLFLCVIKSHWTTEILIAVPVFSRWGMSYALTVFPYARSEGLGSLFKIYSGTKELISATVVALAVTFLIAGKSSFLLLAVTAAAVFFTGRKITLVLGGLTGDVYGFINELLEVILLFTAFIFAHYGGLFSKYAFPFL